MKFRSNCRLFTKSVIQISLIAFVGVAITTFAGGSLTDHFMRKEAVRSEGTRLAQLAEKYFREEISAGAWKNPGGSEAFSIYENLAGTHLFGKHEALRHLAVWGPDGRLIWSSAPDVRPSSEFLNFLEKARRGEAQFFIESLQHGHKNEPAHVDSLLGFIIPLWLEGEMGMDLPDIVLELHTEPQFFFKDINFLRKRVWDTTVGVGVVIFLMAFGGIVWTGHFHEIAKNQASRMEYLGSIARAVSSTLEPAELFRIIVEEI